MLKKLAAVLLKLWNGPWCATDNKPLGACAEHSAKVTCGHGVEITRLCAECQIP